MAKPDARGHDKTDDREKHEEGGLCILCEAIIETEDHEIYFATGYCRYCHEVIEEE